MSAAWLEGPATSTAYGWRLERGDGVTMGFTSHDRDVWVDGLRLRAAPGMQPTTIVESLGMENDGLEVKGALTADAIRREDLLRGRWDGAGLEIFLFDWTAPDAGRRLLARGELGSVSFSGDAFEAELNGPASLLDRAIVPQTSPACRARFCDAECGLNRQRFRHVARVVAVDGSRVEVDAMPPQDLAYGSLRWLSGSACGLPADILANYGEGVTLTQARAPLLGAAGDRIELIEGCDKQLSTCADRFANAVNFCGEPHLPGNDLLTRYPGAN